MPHDHIDCYFCEPFHFWKKDLQILYGDKAQESSKEDVVTSFK